MPNSADLYGSPHGIKVAMFAVDAAMMLGIQATNCIAISVKFDNVAVVQCWQRNQPQSVLNIKSFCFVWQNLSLQVPINYAQGISRSPVELGPVQTPIFSWAEPNTLN